MENQFPVGILGAGLGSRLNSGSGAKPLAPLFEGQSLLALLLERLSQSGVQRILCALRAAQFAGDRKFLLPQAPGLSYLFADTASSLHTLAALITKLGPETASVLFMMADTVMLPDDFARFLAYCSALPLGANAVLVTPFVDDEKPLWVDVDAEGQVTRFGAEKGAFVTSGMYFLSPAAMKIALHEVAAGTHKMRNFLSKLAELGLPINSFVVAKTIDVDHPSDLEKAAQFLLRSGQGRTS
jgi:CTP:molybdopterin cytidylyltransferase MocA